MLQKVLAEKKMAAKFSAAELCSVAEKLFLAELPNLSGQFVVRFIQNGVLQIAVRNSSVGAELRLAETVVLDALKARGAKIKAIRYSVGLPEKILPF
ncbi:MAG: DciA family protein [Patescibacteria group bacterium]